MKPLVALAAVTCSALAAPPFAQSSFAPVAIGADGVGEPSRGFTLFAPMASNDTHLLDNSGTIVHTWPGDFLPGNSVYLLPNGNLLKAIRNTNDPPLPGIAGGVREFDWAGNVVWQFDFTATHHDIAALPNGNVLIIVWETISAAEAVMRPVRITTGMSGGTIGS